jgi:hypothetical protein
MNALTSSGHWFHRVAAVIGGLVLVSTLFAAPARTLDLVTFTAPANWTVEEKATTAGKHVVLTRASTTNYCMVVIYSSTPASGDLGASFAAEWKSVALQTIDAVPMPQPEIKNFGTTRMAMGGTTSKAQGNAVMALLFVLDAGNSVVSMLILSPSADAFKAYTAEVETLLVGLTVRRVGPSTSVPATTGGGTPVASKPTRQLVIADLAGEWGRNDGINTTYVDRATGVYAGTDSIHFTEKWNISANGTISLDFFAIRNGRKIVEKNTGSVSLSQAGILVIKMHNEQKFVLRGWLETPAMTIMTLNGPWYEGIPADILANPAQGWNLDQKWVRKIKAP